MTREENLRLLILPVDAKYCPCIIPISPMGLREVK